MRPECHALQLRRGPAFGATLAALAAALAASLAAAAFAATVSAAAFAPALPPQPGSIAAPPPLIATPAASTAIPTAALTAARAATKCGDDPLSLLLLVSNILAAQVPQLRFPAKFVLHWLRLR